MVGGGRARDLIWDDFALFSNYRTVIHQDGAGGEEEGNSLWIWKAVGRFRRAVIGNVPDCHNTWIKGSWNSRESRWCLPHLLIPPQSKLPLHRALAPRPSLSLRLVCSFWLLLLTPFSERRPEWSFKKSKLGCVYLWLKIIIILINAVLSSSSFSIILLQFSHTDLLSLLKSKTFQKNHFCCCVCLKCFLHQTSLLYYWVYTKGHITRHIGLDDYVFAEYLNEKRRVGFSWWWINSNLLRHTLYIIWCFTSKGK